RLRVHARARPADGVRREGNGRVGGRVLPTVPGARRHLGAVCAGVRPAACRGVGSQLDAGVLRGAGAGRARGAGRCRGRDAHHSRAARGQQHAESR
ncbi:hypothetical protein BN1708_020338, partial [Verticillium longisporum]